MTDPLHAYASQDLIPDIKYVSGLLDDLLIERRAAGVPLAELGDHPHVVELENELAELERRRARLKRLAIAQKERAAGQVSAAFIDEVFSIS